MLSILLNQLAVLNASMKREEGQDMVEYALILGLVSVVAVAAVVGAGTAVTSLWGAVTTALGTATAAL